MAFLRIVSPSGSGMFSAETKADPPGPLGAGGAYVVTPAGARAFYCLVATFVARPGTAALPTGLTLRSQHVDA